MAESAAVLHERGREAAIVLGHANAVGGTAEEGGCFSDAESNIEAFTALREKRLTAQALDHPLAPVREMVDDLRL